MVRVKDGEVGRMVDIAFDLDLLSAQIEVYKLAEDAKTETEAKGFSRSEEAPVFPLAPKVKIRKKRSRRVTKSETRMQSVRAAPPAKDKPKQATFAEAPPPPPGPSGRQPSVTPKDEQTEPVKATSATLVPKDEEGEHPKPNLTPVAVAPVGPSDPGDDDGSMWWVWVVVGVAAAGAAGAGGYFIVTNQDADEGVLTIRW